MASGGKQGIVDRERLAEFVTCSICISFYRKPKILPCTHSFCKECLQLHVDKTLISDCFPCPMCRHQTNLSPDGIEGFRDNYFINSLQDEFNLVSESASCDICLHENITSTATSKCAECCDYLCHKCSETHTKTRFTRDHHVVPMNGESPSVSYSENSTLRCSEHRDELVRYFCTPCQKLICRDCKVLDHAEHKAVSFRDAMEGQKEKLKTETARLGHKMLSMDLTHSRLSRTITYLTTQRDEAFEEIERRKSFSIQRISEAAEKAKEKLDSFSAGVLKTKRSELEEVSFHSAQLKSHKEYTEILLTKASDVEILDNFDSVMNQTSHLVSQDVQLETSHILTLVQNDTDILDEKFRLTDLKINKVLVTKESTTEAPVQTPYGISGISLTNETVFVCQAGRLFKRDTVTWTDVSDSLHTKCGAYDVCIHENNIVVSMKDGNNNLQLVTGDVWLKNLKTIKLPFKSKTPSVAWGSYDGERPTYVVIEAESNSAVRRVDSEGKLLQTYGKDKLKMPRGVAANVHGDVMVAEYIHDDVFIFGQDGRVKCRLSKHNYLIDGSERISRSWSVCVDNSGLIFVSSTGANSILLFSSNGDFIQTLLTAEDGLPTGLSVSPDGRFAVVNGGFSIEIYKYIALV